MTQKKPNVLLASKDVSGASVALMEWLQSQDLTPPQSIQVLLNSMAAVLAILMLSSEKPEEGLERTIEAFRDAVQHKMKKLGALDDD